MPKQVSFGEFIKRYNTDAACLEEITHQRFPNGIICRKCKRVTKHHRIKSRPVYSCKFCRAQTSPLAGTIFERTKLSLTDWFYAIFLISNTRSGLPACELQRHIGVTYITAWKMCKQIRTSMEQYPSMLKGIVEVDEAYIGGKGYWRGKEWWENREEHPKEAVMGFVERGGKIRTKHIQDTSKLTFVTQVRKHIDPTATVYTDKHINYIDLPKFGFKHGSVEHGQKYVDGDIYTNNIESFWSQLKRGLRGVYRHVSPKYLQLYTDEFAFRHNHRHEPEKMFEILLKSTIKKGGGII